MPVLYIITLPVLLFVCLFVQVFVFFGFISFISVALSILNVFRFNDHSFDIYPQRPSDVLDELQHCYSERFLGICKKYNQLFMKMVIDTPEILMYIYKHCKTTQPVSYPHPIEMYFRVMHEKNYQQAILICDQFITYCL